MDLELEGRGALVIGASGDIGRAIVTRLAQEGARIVVGSRDEARLAEAFSTTPAVAAAVGIDLRDDDAIAAATSRAEAVLGGIDLLVCTAAGATAFGGVWDVSRADYVADFDLKCAGTAQVCTRVARSMVERRNGAIVNVIGIATDMTVLSNPVGSAANSGLRSFTRVLAAEVAPAGVRVVGVSPGMTESRRFATFAAEQVEAIRASIPMRTLGLPEQIADVVVFALSPRAGYLTGAIVNVDGGLTLMR